MKGHVHVGLGILESRCTFMLAAGCNLVPGLQGAEDRASLCVTGLCDAELVIFRSPRTFVFTLLKRSVWFLPASRNKMNHLLLEEMLLVL